MQKAPPSPHGPHGELTELSVIGGQELVVAAARVELLRASEAVLTASTLHGAGAIASEDAAAALLDVAD